MDNKTITFISSRGRGLTPDLTMIKDYFTHRYKNEYSFRYYIKNENLTRPFAKEGIIDGKRKFCRDLSHSICMDTSLPINLKNPRSDRVRLFMAVPYDYMFKNALLLEEEPDENIFKSLKSYTHIVPGSPFEEKLLKKVKYTEDKTFINEINLPFAWELINEQRQLEVRKTFEYYFPQMQNKKVIAILTAGRYDKEDEAEQTDPLLEVDIKKIIDAVEDEYFIVTNNMSLKETATTLNIKYCNRFAFVNQLLQIQNILYFADVLITNNSRLAGTFSIRKKPVYCLNYKDYFFEQYMRKHYPKLFLYEIDEMVQRCREGFTEENRKFCEEFCYESEENPVEVIGSLFESV